MSDIDDRGPAGLLGFRRVDGLRTADRRRVAGGRLFRSATPQFVSDDDARRFCSATGLSTVVDLRLPREVAAEGSGGFAADGGPQIVSIPFAIRETVDETSAVAPMNDADPLVGTYLNYLTDRDALVRLVEVMAEPTAAATMIHCTVGKDRTGVACAMILDAIGVLRNDIAADYAAGADDVVQMMALLPTMRSYGAAVDVYPPEAFGSDPGTVLRFLGWVDRLYGGSREYLLSAGATEEMLTALEERLLEPDDGPSFAQVVRSTVVAAAADDVWSVAGDIGAVHRWIPGLTATVLDGAVRSVSFADGTTAREEITARDQQARTYAYRYVDGPIPMDQYDSILSVGPADGGGTLVVWTAALSADESVIAMVESMYDGGLAELTSTAARGFGAHAD